MAADEKNGGDLRETIADAAVGFVTSDKPIVRSRMLGACLLAVVGLGVAVGWSERGALIGVIAPDEPRLDAARAAGSDRAARGPDERCGRAPPPK